MMDGWYGGMGAGGWFLMGLFWLLLVGVIVWAVAQLFPGHAARDGGPSSGKGGDERPEEILDRRLARGEIDPETYDALRDKLLRTGR